MRNVGWFGEETRERKPEPYETDQQKGVRDITFLFETRYRREAELFAKLHATRYEFMARFGPNSIKPFDDLHSVVAQLFVSARVLYNLSQYLQPELTTRETTDGIAKCKADLFSHANPDPISEKVDKIVVAIESITRPIITAKDPWVVVQLRCAGWIANGLSWARHRLKAMRGVKED